MIVGWTGWFTAVVGTNFRVTERVGNNMGIRFLCPEGHKLHVKTFLAGKRAVCPKCGAKVVVPSESQPADLLAAVKGGESGVLPDVSAPAAAVVAPIVEATSAPATAVTAAAQAVSPSPVSSTRASVPDALAENPAALWYVHHPSLGQFGPATADVFRTWLSEGRVSGDSLVWRAGWAEWQSAAATFPQVLRTNEAAAAVATAPSAVTAPNAPPVVQGQAIVAQSATPFVVAPVAPAVAPVFAAPTAPISIPLETPAPIFSPQPTVQTALPVGQVVTAGGAYGGYATGYSAEAHDDVASRSRRRRRKSNDTMMIASGILLALIVVLGIVLAVVLSQQTNPPHEGSSSRPRAKPKSTAPAAPSTKRKPDAEVLVEPLEPEPGADDMDSMDE